jgi:predicted metal-dependent hydrolase
MNEAINAVTTLEGQKITYKIVHSKRARRLRITVTGNGVTVTLPAGIRVVEAEHMLQQNSSWLLAQLERVTRKQAAASAFPPDVILFHGKMIKIEILKEVGRLSRIKVSKSAGKLVVHVPAENGQQPRSLVEPWLKQQARMEIEEAVRQQAVRMNLRVRSVSIRDQRTRWGSCSSKGALSFNWRLVMAPPAVLEYVVIHELAHLRQPNHSPQFWKVVAQYEPDYKVLRQWLRKNAAMLRPGD